MKFTLDIEPLDCQALFVSILKDLDDLAVEQDQSAEAADENDMRIFLTSLVDLG